MNETINLEIIKIKKLLKLENILLLIKIIMIYTLLLFIFYFINDKYYRLMYTIIIYILCINIFNINYKLYIVYVIIALCCVITESIYINFINETWKYNNPDIISIPLWLIFIWSIAILLIIEIINIINKK
jgi:hypothetical protein